jgi:hypothetical protein
LLLLGISRINRLDTATGKSARAGGRAAHRAFAPDIFICHYPVGPGFFSRIGNVAAKYGRNAEAITFGKAGTDVDRVVGARFALVIAVNDHGVNLLGIRSGWHFLRKRRRRRTCKGNSQ